MSEEAMIPARLVQDQRDRTAAALASEHYSTEEREVYEGELHRLDLLLAQVVKSDLGVESPDDHVCPRCGTQTDDPNDPTRAQVNS